jgi:NAD(P)-dependent dehydrogenase (short-subunit alcohol dehydrogenase family)
VTSSEDTAVHLGDLRSDVAFVTGATSGLGRQFAQVLASHGASVAAVGRRDNRLEDLVAEISAEGGRCVGIHWDVTDFDSMVGAVNQAEAAFGPISILVNNAGMADAQFATKLSSALIQQVIATNLTAPFMLSCEIARRMMSRNRPGRIVNISSMEAFNYDGNAAALYSVTKAALNRMTETLAVEWSKFEINVNAIAPGAFASEMMDGMIERLGEFWERFPRKRLGSPGQLDSTLLFLVSPSSGAVTGTVVKVDDGQQSR